MHTADKTEGWRAQYACDFVLPCADDYDAMLSMEDRKLMYVPKFKAAAGVEYPAVDASLLLTLNRYGRSSL